MARSENNTGESGSSSRKRGRSPTAAADPSSSRSGDGSGDGRRGILKRPRTGEQYVPAPVPDIISNIDNTRFPVEPDSDLTDEQKAANARRGRPGAGNTPGDGETRSTGDGGAGLVL